MPTVAISHTRDKYVSIDGYCKMIREAVDELGGLSSFVKPGQHVLIKPDQSVCRPAASGSTTDPLLVAALVRLLRDIGVASIGVVTGGDASMTSTRCSEITRLGPTAVREGAHFVALSGQEIRTQEVEVPEGMLTNRVRLPTALLEADVVIAMPKARTDCFDKISASFEFCLSTVDRDWLMQADGEVIETLADVMSVVRPDLWIIDALICGEGDGPHANRPHWCGSVIACVDPVTADYTVATLLGQDTDRLRFAMALQRRGFGEKRPTVFLGVPPERVAFKAWPAHEGFGYYPLNILKGDGVTEFNLMYSVKPALDNLLSTTLLQNGPALPTLVIGDVDDPEFEQHLAQGPYIVFGDSAKAKYKYDPRVFWISERASPNALEELLKSVLGKRSPASSQRLRGLAVAGMAIGAGLWMRRPAKR